MSTLQGEELFLFSEISGRHGEAELRSGQELRLCQKLGIGSGEEGRVCVKTPRTYVERGAPEM